MGGISKDISILVTGAKGFIGSNLIKYLRELGFTRINDNLAEQVDFRNPLFCEGATSGRDWVFHLAANMGGIGYFSEENYYPVIDNYLMDLNILRACEENKVKRLFYPASACAYSVDLMNQGYPLEESTLFTEGANPDQMYGWEKLTMIKLMKNSPVNCRVGILHTIYGEGQEYEGKKAKFIPQMVYKIIQSEKTGEVEVWGNGKQTRTFLYIRDAVRKIYELMASDGYWGEVNIGSDIETTINDIVHITCKQLNLTPRLTYNYDKPVGPKRRRCNNSKFNKHYKTRQETDLNEGIRKVIDYIHGNI